MVAPEGNPGGKFRAVLVSITNVRSVTAELMPFVTFRANIEKREVNEKDQVAIFNVYGTASNFVVFLDAGKTPADVEEELVPYNVVISRADWQMVINDLEGKALYLEATKG